MTTQTEKSTRSVLTLGGGPYGDVVHQFITRLSDKFQDFAVNATIPSIALSNPEEQEARSTLIRAARTAWVERGELPSADLQAYPSTKNAATSLSLDLAA